MKLTIKAAKANFFDRDAVIRAVGKARAKALNDAGRLVRKAALKSIGYEDGPSSPGSPPHAHRSRKFTRTSRRTGKRRTRTASFLREFLYYKFDPSTQTVVVGPERLSSTVDPRSLPALEYGGPSTVIDHGNRKSVRIRARPFMGPALKAEAPNFAGMWRNSIR